MTITAKNLISLVGLFLLLTFGLTALAQGERATTTNRGETAPANRGNPTTTNNESREAARANRDTVLAERLTSLAETMAERLFANTERLRQFIVRLEVHVERLEASGADASRAKALIEEAREELRLASEAVNNVLERLDNWDGEQHPRVLYPPLRDAFAEAVEHIRNAHTTLRAAIPALRDAMANRPETLNPTE